MEGMPEGWTLEDLQRDGYRIYQKKDAFRFGMDAVLLSWFAVYRDGDRIMDLCTGNGVIPLLMDARREGRTASFTGIDIQEEAVELALASVKLNQAESRICIENADIREASALCGRGSFDIVTCNPPYIKQGSGIVNPTDKKAIARHEILCTLDDVMRESAGLLKDGGKLYLVYRPKRLKEVFLLAERYHLSVSRLKFVHPYEDREAVLVLIEAVKGTHSELHTEAPVIIYQADNVFSEEISEIYGDGRH